MGNECSFARSSRYASLLALQLGACVPAGSGRPMPTELVLCADEVELFSFSGSLEDDVETRQLGAVVTETPGEVTIELVDAASVRFHVDEDAPPLLPTAGPVRVIPWEHQCWGEGCDTTFLALETDELGRFLEVGSLNMLDDNPFRFGPEGSPLSLRSGTGGDRCPANGGEVPAVLQVASDAGPVEILPGEATDLLVGGQLRHARGGNSRRAEFLYTDRDCADCASAGLHSDTEMSALLYRRATP